MHLTLEDMRTAVADNGGSLAAAARTLGVPRSTLYDRLKGSVSPKDNQRIKTLEKRLEEQHIALERARKPRVKLKPSRKPGSQKGDFSRMVIPDTHGCYMDEPAVSAMLADMEAIRPKQVVLLGDHLDCAGFLSQHLPTTYVTETIYTFEDDVAACNTLLDSIQKIVPKAEIHYLEGNHERRLERFVTNHALKNPSDANYLQRMFSVNSVLSLEKRGIHWYRQGVFYAGLAIPATLKLDDCYFTHGSSTAMHAAKRMLDDFGGNVVYGHTHRADSFTKRTVRDGVIAAWNPGCLMVLNPPYVHTQITGWSHGYGLQFVREKYGFLHINVPISEGRSYLVPFTQNLM